MYALGATLALRRDTFRRHARSLGKASLVPPTREQEAFWIYVYFQGEGRARRYLEKNGGYGYAAVPDASLRMGEIRRLALERVAAWKLIQQRRIFTA